MEDEITNKILSDEKLVSYLDNNDFSSFYEYVYSENVVWPDETHLITEILLDCGINPLEYMDYVPKYYLSGTKMRYVEIHDNIITIGRGAFAGSSVQNVKFGRNLKEIYTEAFYGCDDLAVVDLSHTNIESIDDYAFGSGNPNCELGKIILPNTIETVGEISAQSFSIEYLGTADQWKYVDHPNKHRRKPMYDVYIKG